MRVGQTSGRDRGLLRPGARHSVKLRAWPLVIVMCPNPGPLDISSSFANGVQLVLHHTPMIGYYGSRIALLPVGRSLTAVAPALCSLLGGVLSTLVAIGPRPIRTPRPPLGAAAGARSPTRPPTRSRSSVGRSSQGGRAQRSAYPSGLVAVTAVTSFWESGGLPTVLISPHLFRSRA